MSVFSHLCNPPSIPKWHGESQVHVLSDHAPRATPRQNGPRLVLKPWTLIRPGSREERTMLASRRNWWKLHNANRSEADE